MAECAHRESLTLCVSYAHCSSHDGGHPERLRSPPPVLLDPNNSHTAGSKNQFSQFTRKCAGWTLWPSVHKISQHSMSHLVQEDQVSSSSDSHRKTSWVSRKMSLGLEAWFPGLELYTQALSSESVLRTINRICF